MVAGKTYESRMLAKKKSVMVRTRKENATKLFCVSKRAGVTTANCVARKPTVVADE